MRIAKLSRPSARNDIVLSEALKKALRLGSKPKALYALYMKTER